MNYYNNSRSQGLTHIVPKNITEDDKTRLIADILKNNFITLYDDFSLYHAVVSRMKKDSDERIVEEISASKVRRITANKYLMDNIKTRAAKELLIEKE